MIHSERAFSVETASATDAPSRRVSSSHALGTEGAYVREEPLDLAQREPELLLHIVEGERVVGHDRRASYQRGA